MEFNFGEKMKSLRRKRDLTQEQLAERLGVSFQAVSKWETNAAYPDIALFPVIANFYGVTTDELLGVDISKAKEKQQKYIKDVWELQHQWKLGEMVELARKACLEFPGNHEMLDNLSWCLSQASGKNKAYLDEAIDISKKILEESTDNGLRNRATARLVYCYNYKGDKDKALEYAMQLPRHAQTYQFLTGRLGLLKGKEKIEFSQNCIISYFEALREVMIQYADVEYENAENQLSHAEKIEVLENVLRIQEIVYGDDLCDHHFESCVYYYNIAEIYLLMDSKDYALDNLDKAYAHAKKFTQYQDGDKYRSVALKDRESNPHHRWSRSAFEDMLDRLTNQKRYDVIRDEPRFTAILEKLSGAK